MDAISLAEKVRDGIRQLIVVYLLVFLCEHVEKRRGGNWKDYGWGRFWLVATYPLHPISHALTCNQAHARNELVLVYLPHLQPDHALYAWQL